MQLIFLLLILIFRSYDNDNSILERDIDFLIYSYDFHFFCNSFTHHHISLPKLLSHKNLDVNKNFLLDDQTFKLTNISYFLLYEVNARAYSIGSFLCLMFNVILGFSTSQYPLDNFVNSRNNNHVRLLLLLLD